jgi:hypothetical protein
MNNSTNPSLLILPAPLRWLVIVALPPVGLLCLFFLTRLLGYGTDVYYSSLGASAATFLVGGLFAFQRKCLLINRLIVLAAFCLLAISTWCFLPNNLSDGFSLFGAVYRRDDLNRRLAGLSMVDYDSAGAIFRECGLLDKYYPSLAAEPQYHFLAWKQNAIDSLKNRYYAIPLNDVSSAVAVQRDESAFARFFSDEKIIVKAGTEWIERAMAHHCQELGSIPLGNWDEFNKNAGVRFAFAHDIFNRNTAPLYLAESRWASLSVTESISRLNPGRVGTPKQTLEMCREIESHLLSLTSIDNSPKRFYEARDTLFRLALFALEAETNKHIKAGRADIAYGIARKFAVDWFSTAEILGPDQINRLEELRDKCRDRADIAERGGDGPEVTPLPRERETAPPPRIKS